MTEGNNTALPVRTSIRTLEDLAAFVRSTRIIMRVTQSEMAARVGKSRRWLQDVERGRVALSFPAALALLEALGYLVSAERPVPDPLLDQVFGGLS